MRLSITSFWAILILFVSGCTSQKEVVETPNPPPPPTQELDAKTLAISFEQTACYGTCPVHKMEVFGKGYATYVGERHVKNEGNFIGSFTEEQIQDIFKKAEELDFFNLEKEYTANITDLPTTIIYINNGSQKHKVIAYSGYPENLKEFIQYLYKLTETTQWNSDK